MPRTSILCGALVLATYVPVLDWAQQKTADDTKEVRFMSSPSGAPQEVVESLDQVLRYKAQLLATEPKTREEMLERSQKLQLVNWSLMNNDGMSPECVALFESGSGTVPSDDQERMNMRQAKQNLAEIDQELAHEFGGLPPVPTIKQIAEAAAKWGAHWPEHIER
jgi:hypothetical protein